MAVKKSKKQQRSEKKYQIGRLYVSTSFNNTLVTLTDMEGNVLTWSSSGNMGFKGTKKSTPYAATTALEKVINKAKEDFHIEEVEIYIKGPGAGRDSALRAVRASGLKIGLIADVTPIPHDGPRPKKKRRV